MILIKSLGCYNCNLKDLSFIKNDGDLPVTSNLVFKVQKIENSIVVDENIIYNNQITIPVNNQFYITDLFNDLNYSCSEVGDFRLLVSYGGVESYEEFSCG
jgi:hypothetical protein